jgi:hypothetical protein
MALGVTPQPKAEVSKHLSSLPLLKEESHAPLLSTRPSSSERAGESTTSGRENSLEEKTAHHATRSHAHKKRPITSVEADQ